MQIPVEYFMWVGVVGSCGHLAHVLPFFHLRRKWWCEGNRDMEWWGSWLRAEWHATQTYWWIFHVQPQSEQQKTLMFVYTSVLLSCIQVALIMNYYSNKKTIQRLHIGLLKSCFPEENICPAIMVNATSPKYSWNPSKHTKFLYIHK